MANSIGHCRLSHRGRDTHPRVGKPSGGPKWWRASSPTKNTRATRSCRKNLQWISSPKAGEGQRGRGTQYYVANSHPAIHCPEIFDLVQYELKKAQKRTGFLQAAPSSLLRQDYLRTVRRHLWQQRFWHPLPGIAAWSGNATRSIVHCKTAPIWTNEQIEHAFLKANHSLLQNRDCFMRAQRM